MKLWLATVALVLAVGSMLATHSFAQTKTTKDEQPKKSLYILCIEGNVCSHCNRSAGCCDRACKPLK